MLLTAYQCCGSPSSPIAAPIQPASPSKFVAAHTHLASRREMAAVSAVRRTANCCLSTVACRISESIVGSL